MNVNVAGFNTLPSRKDWFWQVVLIPTVCLLKNIEKEDPYTAVTFEWLFWSCTLIFSNGKTKRASGKVY